MQTLKNIAAKLFSTKLMLKESQRMSDSYNSKDLYSTFIKVAWPALIETVLIGFIGFADSIMVSTVGEAAIAAVGLTTQPRMLFYSVFFALSIGVNAIVARRKGENDREGANKVLSQVLPITLVLGIILVSIAVIFAEPLMIFSGAKEDTVVDAVSYFRYTIVGMLFTALSLMINSAQRASGNTKISMKSNLIANIVNVVFNALLINGLFFFPKLGVTGAAIATLMGNVVSLIISFRSVIYKDRFLYLDFRKMFKFDKSTVSLISKISGSAAVEQLFIRVGFFTFAKIIAELGTVAFSTHQICMSIINLSFTFGDGLGIAASALVGQNLGRKRPDVSLINGKIAQRIGLALSAILFVIFFFQGEILMKMFSDDPEIIESGIFILKILAFISPAQISQVIFGGCLRGAGDTKFIAVMSLVCITIIRPVLTFVLVNTLEMGVTGAWIAMTFDQYLRLLLTFLRFSSGKWSKISF